MDRLGFENLSLYFLKLVRYGADVERAQRELPPEKPEEIEWEDVYKLADKHSLTALIYRVVQNLKEKPSEELLKKWEHEYMVGLLADSQQLYAWEELQEVFSEKGLKIPIADNTAPMQTSPTISRPGSNFVNSIKI